MVTKESRIIIVTEDNEIRILCESVDATMKEDRLFVLELDEKSSISKLSSSNAEILFLKELLLVTLDSRSYLFILEGTTLPSDLNKDEIYETVEGLGLADVSGPDNGLISSRSCTCKKKREKAICDSGGPGAKSCSSIGVDGGSISGCSVTCSRRRYACCID